MRRPQIGQHISAALRPRQQVVGSGGTEQPAQVAGAAVGGQGQGHHALCRPAAPSTHDRRPQADSRTDVVGAATAWRDNAPGAWPHDEKGSQRCAAIDPTRCAVTATRCRPCAPSNVGSLFVPTSVHCSFLQFAIMVRCISIRLGGWFRSGTPKGVPLHGDLPCRPPIFPIPVRHTNAYGLTSLGA